MLNALIVITQGLLRLPIKKLLKKYTKIWEKINSLMNKEFDSVLVYGYNDKWIKTKLEIHGENVNTNFHGKKVPEENSSYKYLSLMSGSVIRVNKTHYFQTLLEEYIYEIKQTKMENLMNDDLDPSLSDNETDNEDDNDESNEFEN